jgi:hypothetical protein
LLVVSAFYLGSLMTRPKDVSLPASPEPGQTT